VRGTQIAVEDLFFNVPLRRKAFKSTSEEYQRIVEVVTRYAVQNAGVCITCKRAGEATADVHTSAGAGTLDTIRALYGPALARELIEACLSLWLSGCVCLTGRAVPRDERVARAGAARVHQQRQLCRQEDHLHSVHQQSVAASFLSPSPLSPSTERLVDSGPLRRAIERVYGGYLPKGTHPFVFVSLQLPPAAVDVNVHPTKSEARAGELSIGQRALTHGQVHFLNEERVVEFVQRAVDARLVGGNMSRTFYTQVRRPHRGRAMCGDTRAQTVLPVVAPDPAESDTAAAAALPSPPDRAPVTPQHKVGAAVVCRRVL
jgi:DNA mismatch repair protein MLH1